MIFSIFFLCSIFFIFHFPFNLFSIFVCFFMIAKYQGQLQIFNKVVLNGVNQFWHCIVLLLFYIIFSDPCMNKFRQLYISEKKSSKMSHYAIYSMQSWFFEILLLNHHYICNDNEICV